MSVAKTNVYRSLVDQPLLAGNTNTTTVATDYCQNLVNIAPARNQLDLTKDAGFGTPVAAVGNNLSTFLGNRLNMAFTNLGCQGFGLTNPATVTLDGNMIATAVTYNLTQQMAGAGGAGAGASPSASASATGAGTGTGASPSPSASATAGNGGNGGNGGTGSFWGHGGRHHRHQNPSGM
jgi:hypothetical protein